MGSRMRDGDLHIGARIAEQRRLAHLTGRGLAQRASVSYSLLSKVESGNRPASPALVAAVARALHIEASTLMGQPFQDDQRDARYEAPLAAVRAALENWDVPLEPQTAPRPLREVHRDVQRMNDIRRGADYLTVLSGTPPLIEELVHHSHHLEGRELERLHRALAFAYRCVHDATHKLGHLDLSNIILARMVSSAERSGDPYLVMLTGFLRAQSCFSTGRHDIGLRLMEQCLADVAPAADRGETPALCVQGNLRLRATILAARTAPGVKAAADAARAHWDEAWATARRLGGETTNYLLSYGPSNALVHQVALEVEVGEYGRALRLAADVHLDAGFARRYPDRVSHHLIDISRAQLWTGDRAGAYESLRQARAAAPQQVRFHPQARDTVRALRRAADREGVGAMARWMGV
ncbi:helix-turn-helix domain-containing protein [Streptomyces spiramenti]|uniref:Helix-turn-helix transcriptional regulator n=1 Tax=Streptomyces spiramenti TaxID=2720606 RepID=A0ABX1AK40_9ACTN|nr:helix-turn-helix transcriptional regulator [Streptomyces spiramenti]NJP66036.1 helix-turn-helix transcriptional regulator [Streptomyces spiramenti]